MQEAAHKRVLFLRKEKREKRKDKTTLQPKSLFSSRQEQSLFYQEYLFHSQSLPASSVLIKRGRRGDGRDGERAHHHAHEAAYDSRPSSCRRDVLWRSQWLAGTGR